MISWSCTCWAQVSFLLYELGPLRTQNDSSMKPAIGLGDPTFSFQFDDFALLNMAQGTHTHAQILQMHLYALRTLNCVKTNPILIRYTSPFLFVFAFCLFSPWIALGSLGKSLPLKPCKQVSTSPASCACTRFPQWKSEATWSTAHEERNKRPREHKRKYDKLQKHPERWWPGGHPHY